MPLITLTSDFGLQDYYVGAMRGAILRLAPEARLVDLSHCIPPQDLLAGAWILRHAATEFPPGTVHLAVVDPGVGSARRPLVLASGGYLWVGPDNGLFSFALQTPGWRAYEIYHPELRGPRLSSTFHGRDLFAPAAAHLATGFPLESVGPPVSDPVRLEEASPRREEQGLLGQVIHVDRFGNLTTNIPGEAVASWGEGWRLCLGTGQVLTRLCRTYAEAEPGALLALVGSAGLLEVAVKGGSAARRLRLGRRGEVRLELPSP
ncbi:MAG: SAM-dependent chlorinase/fluorinase [Candidatus Latescibacteria bacterium]|nr:SAM-dependent chlorinase/fluorinase [Candidatus Latescibacterota bacterium]